ncbi:histidine phosphatase family protein, partial [Acinetobacter calcoaceticus]
MSTSYLVRHGQASFGAASYDQLSAKGEQQSQSAGEFLNKTLKSSP